MFPESQEIFHFNLRIYSWTCKGRQPFLTRLLPLPRISLYSSFIHGYHLQIMDITFGDTGNLSIVDKHYCFFDDSVYFTRIPRSIVAHQSIFYTLDTFQTE